MRWTEGDDRKARELTYRQRLRIALGVVRGLDYLHTGGGVEGDRCWHRDVKSANICLTATLEAKLIDYGLAKFMPAVGEGCSEQMSSIAGRVGTRGYRCLRSAEGGSPFGESTEVFALGVVLLELVVGQVTLTDRYGTNLYFHFVRDKKSNVLEHFDRRADGDGEWPAELKQEWVQLITGCLRDDPDERLGIADISERLEQLTQTYGQLTLSEQALRDVRSREAEQ